MEPIIKELDLTKTLLHTAVFSEKEFTEVTIKRLAIRPVLKRIVFMTKEFDRVIVYEGETDFEAHKADSDETLITALLAKIDAEFKKI